MNLYDKIKSPFEDEETIKRIIRNFSDNKPQSSGEFYHYVLRDNNEPIDNDLYMDCFDENIYWPLLENDWKNIENDVSKSEGLKKIYDRFESYQELFNYINKLDKETKEALTKYREYSRRKNPDIELANKYKTILQGKTSNVGELLAAYSLYRDLPQSHNFHSQDLMGFHFNSQIHDRTATKENAEIKFYVNAGENSFKVARLFWDKCRNANVDSYYFKVVDPMHNEQERDDRLCIYSSIDHSKTFLEFLTQIRNENPDISFRRPPLTVGVIDEFVGIGTDTLDKESSYNQTIGSVIYDTLEQICREKSIKKENLFSYVKNNPNALENIKRILIQKSAEKGCSREKTCITDKLGERLKTVEISDTAERVEDKKKGEEIPDLTIKEGSIQVYDENGNITFSGFINPSVLDKKITLPNGNQISAKQYIQENFAPYIPESGTFKLKNGIEISARQFIEEQVIYNLENYNGDIDALMKDTIAETDEPPQKDGWTVPTHGQERGVSIESFKKSLECKRKETKLGMSDVQNTQSNIQNIQHNRYNQKGKYNGQSR